MEPTIFTLNTDDDFTSLLSSMYSIVDELPNESLHDPILDSDMSEAIDLILDDPVAKPTKKQPTKKGSRMKRQLDDFRQHVHQLQQTLSQLKSRRLNQTPWEAEARNQAEKRHKAEKENESLKQAIAEQKKFSETLQNLINDAPNVDECWKFLKLSATMPQRVQGMHQIADREYDKVSSVLLNAGMFDLEEQFHKMRVNKDSIPENYSSENCDKVTISKNIELEVIRHQAFKGLDHVAVGDMAWKMHTADTSSLGDSFNRAAFTRLESFGDNLVYLQMKSSLQNDGKTIPKVSNFILKRYTEKHRTILVWKSILEDELFPYDPDAIIFNDTGIFVIENKEIDGISSCSAKLVFKIHPPVSSSKERFKQMLKMVFVSTSQMYGFLPKLLQAQYPVTLQVDDVNTQLPDDLCSKDSPIEFNCGNTCPTTTSQENYN